MANHVTQARTTIAEALNTAGLTTFASNPPTAPLPSAVINPGSPYLEVVSISGKPTYRMTLVISITVPSFSTEAALAQLEDLIDLVVVALPSGVTTSTIGSPRLEYLGEGQGSVYLAEINVTALVKE